MNEQYGSNAGMYGHGPLEPNITAIPEGTQRLLDATRALVQRYFADPGHEFWTHAKLDAVTREVAREYQVEERWVRGMFGKVIIAQG